MDSYELRSFRLLPCVCLHGFLDLRFHGIEVEARALLHGRVLEGRHGQLRHLLLDEHEAPELEPEPVKILVRSVISRRATGFARRDPGADSREPARRYGPWLPIQPSGWSMKRYLKSSIRTAAEVAFREVEDFVTIRRPLAGNHVHLVIAVEMVSCRSCRRSACPSAVPP